MGDMFHRCGFLSLLMTACLLFFPMHVSSAQKSDRFASPDGEIVAIVVHVGKEQGLEAHESRVEVRTKEGMLLCVANYSSQDGEHGYGIAKAEWTPDSQFFVYSMQSSGGHQPWHAPVEFYDRRQKKIVSLDDALNDNVADPKFSIEKPDRVTVTLYSSMRQVSIKLSKLSLNKSRRKMGPA